MIQLTGLSKSYPNREAPVFEDISCKIEEGSRVGIIGPSGVGKSTLLRVIAGLEGAIGRVLIDGRESAMARDSGAIGFAFQEASLLPWRTVLENLELPFRVLGREVDTETIARLKRLLRLEGLDDDYPDALSGGMAKRVALARAMVHRPKVLLLDEPLGGIDWPLRRSIMTDLSLSWHEFWPTAVVVSHEVREVAFLCEAIWVMSGSPASLAQRIEVPFQKERSIELLREDKFLRFCAELEHLLPIT